MWPGDPTVPPERGTFELDRDHPLASALVCFSVFGVGGGTVLRNDAGQTAGIIGSGLACGPDYLVNTASLVNLYYPGSAINLNVPNVTIVYDWWPAGAYNDGQPHYQFGTLTSGGYFDIVKYSDGQLYCGFNGHRLVTRVDASNYVAGQWQQMAITSGLAGGQWYRNARLINSFPDPVYSSANGAVSLFRGPQGESCIAGCRMRRFAVYQRRLSPSEIAWLAAEPYAHLRPLRRRIYSVGSPLFRRTRTNRTGSRGAAA